MTLSHSNLVIGQSRNIEFIDIFTQFKSINMPNISVLAVRQ